MSTAADLVSTLPQYQQDAISVIKTAIDCYNSVDGAGLFAGVDRYNNLLHRVEICAVQADNLPRFWALLLHKMCWEIPPRKMDARIIACLSANNAEDVLRCLSEEAASIVTLARMLHAEQKAELRDLYAAGLDSEETKDGS